MEQKKQEPIRDARQLGTAKMLILGLQHMFAMFGATILVPILVSGYFQKACGEPLTRGLSVSVTLFCAGFGTLIFHLCTKFKVPAFLGSSFAFLGGFYTVANLDSGMYADMAVNDKAAYACGGIFVAGMLYFILALIIKLVGIKRVMRFLPPVVTGPIIICIGLSLAGSAINNASTNWVLAIIALGVIIIFNIWGKGLFKIIPILMGVIISYVVAFIMNAAGITNPDGSAILDFTSIASSAWVGIPKFQFMKFDITSILVMAPIAIATMMEHIGDMSAISATVEQNFIADPGLHRTLIGDGIATAFAGAIGGPANTTYGENTGVLELSKVYDPRVIRIAAVFAIALSFIPKFSAVISTMPSAIIGGVSFMLYGMISAIGVRNVVENKVDLTKSRNLIIAGVIFVCGLGFGNGLTFTVAGTSITLTALAIAAIAGIFLNAILPGNDYEFGKNPDGDASRGVYMMNTDNDEEEEGSGKSRIRFAPLAVFCTFFVAELGDKTQLTAITFGANEGMSSALIVWIGCSLGLFLADILGMLLGYLLKSKTPEGLLNTLAFTIFSVFGVFTLYQGLKLINTDVRFIPVLPILIVATIVFAGICVYLFLKREKAKAAN